MSGEQRRATVGVTADRRADDQALMLERLGLRVIRGPALATELYPDGDALRATTVDLIAHPPDYVVADTGIGIRTWLSAAESWGLKAELLAALAQARIAARGPKAVGALRSAGLEVWWRAPSEQLAAVVDHPVALPLAGTRVAVQLHGEDEPATLGRLEGAGAEAVPVPVYQWNVPPDGPALDLVRRTIAGEVDAITFTSAPAVRNLVGVARRAGVGGDFIDALNGGVLVACVGPVCAEAARTEGIADPMFPEHWRLPSLVALVGDELGRRREAVESHRP
jgi:uroporphyrinogen-III synthase